ncbi:hypothetical protein, variant 2 [Aphanomyces invadans]|uniref:Uncharacterized protein n=1 Tax=Aphanomyces invadans TaxID=157072 RepID=A0A024U1T2_9STRA|nr:hypothetical protein, variant 2 [Aphanomyces invadans]ETW00180.1 hypothetical protein, variant 2 [Aphanomyces invadans]|eukprot:XP_008871205.1 hypothetical protein, variant 2 [Aphanomyces invadans]
MDDDEHAFDFGVSAAPASLQTHNEIWADIKHRCREMSSAKTKKNRGPALMEFQNMVSSLKHQQVLHASGTWSFVITALIQVIEVDFSALLKKKHATGGDFKLDHEATMNNLLDYAHTHTSPASSTAVLDRDTVGRTALKRLVSFCEAILVKPSLEQTPAEGSALRILDKLFRFNAYCRAVDESKLKKVLERVLYVLNDRTSSNLLLASRIALSILTNFQSDLHTRLPGFMEFFHQWFQDIRSEAEGSRLPHPSYGRSVSVDAVARNVLSCMVVLMRQYGPHMVPLLQVHAHEVVQYVLYNLKDDVVVLSTEPAEFLIMYYRLVHYSTAAPSSIQVRELKQLHAMCVLDNKILATVVRHVATTFKARTPASFNEKAILWLSMVADVMFYTDQWSFRDSTTKRSRHMTGLDTILTHLQVDAVSPTAVPQISQLTSTQTFKDVALPRLKWLLLMQALLSRHGHWLVEHQVDGLQSLQSLLMKLLEDGKLEAECKEQTLQCLLSLALYMPNENGSSSWHRLWQTLLSDYSFRNMTKFESGDVVVQLLSALVALNYVSAAMLECDLAAILEFPVFSSPSVHATLLLHLIQTRVDTNSCKGVWSLQDISAYFFKTLAQQSFARDGIGHATPLLVSAIGSIVSSGPTGLDCTPYLVSALWVGCTTCDLPDHVAAVYSKRDSDVFQVRRHAQLTRLAEYFARECQNNRDVVPLPTSGRIAFPTFVDLRITLDPSALVAARAVHVKHSPAKSQAVMTGNSILLDEMHKLFDDVVEMCDTSSTDQFVACVEALMNVGVVFAGVVDVFSLDAPIVMKNLLTAVWSRMSKWLASPNAVGLLQKLLCMLQLLGRSGCVDQDGKGKFPPSCRAILSCIGTNVEEFITTNKNADVPDVDDDEVDTSRWASVAFKKSQSRLWCLRIHQLLQYEQRRASMSSQSSKQEDSAQLIRQVVEQNYVSAFQCLALIPSLGRPLTNEGLATIVFLLQSTLVSHPVEVCEHLEHVAVAISRQQFKGTSASYDLGVVFDTLLELRKTKKSPRHLRRALILAYEQLFLMDVDRFVDFSDYMMASFLDHDIGVQVASLSVLQSAYAKYDEGVVAIFHDVESLLKNQASHMIVAALACFISAGSADVLLSRVLALYSLWFDAEPELFRACTDGLATLYGYETPLSMLEDMCWPTLCHYAELGPQLKAKRDLSQFPMALFGESLVRLTESHLVPSFASLVLLLNESNQDFHHLDKLNIPNVTELKPSVLVVLAWAKQKSTPCAVTPEMTLTILHYLLNLNAYAAETYPLQWCTFEAMVCRPVNLVDIALMLHAWLGEHRLKSLATEPIKFLCEAVDALSTGSSNGHAISQRIVLHVLLQHAQIFDVVCALKRVCDQWARDPDVFGQNVNFLICGLVLRYTALPMKNQEVVEDIAHAISRVQKLGKFLAKLNPFPSNISPGLNQLQRSYSTDEPVIQTLAEKFTRPLLQTSPLTTEGLRSLQDIVVSNADEQHVPTIVHGLLAKAYQNALRENDTDKQVQIATCLGLMGAVFPADILSHDVGRLEVLYLQLFSRPSLAALSKAKDAWLELLGKLLECLILMLFESDGKVVHIAHNTVKALLQLEEVQVAVDHMKSHSHGLKTFLQNIPSAMLPPRPPPLVRTTSRWSPADHASFREWVCHVCCLLIKQSRHPTFAVCLEMCAFHERIAVFLLPLAIYFVLGTDATELVMLEQLLVQESSLPLKHGQVLVQTINYVRHLQMIKSQHASWSLPYLQVAQLALRCKMPYSALQYVELHLEQTFGTIQPDDRLSSDVTNILLQAYKEINAVDAIDGVRQVGHSFADQLAIYALEKRFSDCLPLYDAISRQEGTQAHHNGLAKTLHSLGYTNLLETYLSTHDSSGISKFQYQMAWKQNQWSLKAPAATTPTSANFHGLLYGCLKSMATNDGHQFHQLVVQAKTSILANQDLSFTGLEMTKTLHKSMVQLETVAKLECVWKIKVRTRRPLFHRLGRNMCVGRASSTVRSWLKCR